MFPVRYLDNTRYSGHTLGHTPRRMVCWLARLSEKRKIDSMANLYPNDLPQQISLTKQAEAIQDWFDRHTSLGLNKDNRVLKLCKTMRESTHTIEKDDPDWAKAVQSLKDIHEYWFIFHVLNEQLCDSPFLSRLKLSLEDSTLPVESGDETVGRNTQFELLLAAVAVRAELKVKDFGSSGADWKLVAPFRQWSLEAKRIKSWPMAEKRIRKAAKQIKATGLAGVIALDISAANNPSYEPLKQYVTDDELSKAMSKRGKHLHAHFLPDVSDWIGSRPVGFLLVHDFVIRPAGHNSSEEYPWSLKASWDRFDLLSADSQFKESFDELWSFFEAGLPQL